MNLEIVSHCRITENTVLLNGNLVPIVGSDKGKTSWLDDIYRSLGIEYLKFFKMDSLCKAGFLAAELVCKDVHCKESNAAIVCFNSSSSLADDMIYQQTICDKNNYYPSPSVFVYTLANIVTGEIAIRHKITGESSFYIIENFSPIQIHNAITDIFDNDTVHYLLCGWTEYNDKHCDVLMMYIKRNGQPSANISPQSISDLYFFVK